MPEFMRVEWRRPLECTLVFLHFMVLLRIRVNVPLTLTRGPGKHETKKRQTDMDILLAPHQKNIVIVWGFWKFSNPLRGSAQICIF